MSTQSSERIVLEISGADRVSFLQGLVTNDVNKSADALVYAALLTPQGKYLADFFLLAQGDVILVDVASFLAPALEQRLLMYRLRADVVITAGTKSVLRGLGDPPDDGFADPRHAALGWRAYRDNKGATVSTDWTAVRVAHCIPESGIELVENETYILEAGFEKLHGVDFKKGCYVGQEIVARMKHKTQLKKGLARVIVKGGAPVGTEILANGKSAGVLFSQSDGSAIAQLRFDRADGPMTAGQAVVTYQKSEI